MGSFEHLFIPNNIDVCHLVESRYLLKDAYTLCVEALLIEAWAIVKAAIQALDQIGLMILDMFGSKTVV